MYVCVDVGETLSARCSTFEKVFVGIPNICVGYRLYLQTCNGR